MKTTSAGRRRIELAHHKALVQFLKMAELQYPLLKFVKHTRNESTGGPKVTRRDRKTGREIQIPLDVIQGSELGVRAGVWDFEYLGANRRPFDGMPAGWYAGLAVELKAPGNGLSPEQKQWKEHYEANQWYTVVFERHEDAALFLVDWVGGDPDRFLFT